MPRKPIAESLILEALTRNFPDSISWSKILETTGLSKRAVHIALKQLEQKGEIRHVPRGKYSLAHRTYEKHYPNVIFKEFKDLTYDFTPEHGTERTIMPGKYVKEWAFMPEFVTERTIRIGLFYNEKMPITIGDYDTPLLNSLEESIAKFLEDIKNIIPEDKLQVLLIAKF